MKLTASLIGALSFISPPAHAAGETAIARSYLLVRDDIVLRSHAPTLELPPASLTKLLTALVVLDSNWSADRWLPVSRAAAAQAPTRIGLREGEQLHRRCRARRDADPIGK